MITHIKHPSFDLLTTPDNPEFTQSLQCPQGSSGDVKLPELRSIPPQSDLFGISTANYAQLTAASSVALLNRGKMVTRMKSPASASRSSASPATNGRRSLHTQMMKTERKPDTSSNAPANPASSQLRIYRSIWAAQRCSCSATSFPGSLQSREATIFLWTLARLLASLRIRITGTGNV